MLINIRRSVFETNSSSTHSVAIRGLDYWTANFDIKANADNNVYIVKPGIYDWGYEVLGWFSQKLSYIVTAIGYYDVSHDVPDSIYFHWLAEMFKSHTGLTLVYECLDHNTYPGGHIDHQSLDTLESFWSEYKTEFQENMKAIIFSSKYSIIIDNDNH